MTEQDPRPEPPEPDEGDGSWLRRYAPHLTVIGAVTIVAIAYAGVPSIPRRGKIALLAGVPMLGWGLFLAQMLEAQMPEPPEVLVVELDYDRESGWLARAVPLPMDVAADLEVTDGQLDKAAPDLWFVEQLDLHDRVAYGTWFGTLSNRKLASAFFAIDVCRGQLEQDAKEGFAAKVGLWEMARQSTLEATSSVFEALGDGRLPDHGEGVQSAVDDVMPDAKDAVHSAEHLAEQSDLDYDPELVDELIDRETIATGPNESEGAADD